MKENLLEAPKTFKPGWTLAFQQDDDLKHTTRSKIELFRSNHSNDPESLTRDEY